MTVTDSLIKHMTGLTPAQQKASKNVYVAGSGAYSAFNVILNGATAISPIPERAWNYIFVEILNEARAVNPNQLGTTQMTLEIGVKTNQKDDTSLRKLEEAVKLILDDLQDNEYLDTTTLGLVSLSANYETGIDENARPFARYANINLVYKMPRPT
jgi:hypothetical protein